MEQLSPILRLATENSNTPTELVDEKEAARRLHVLASTMSHWRKQRRAGKQAPVVKLIQFGKLVHYRTEDLDHFLQEQTHE